MAHFPPGGLYLIQEQITDLLEPGASPELRRVLTSLLGQTGPSLQTGPVAGRPGAVPPGGSARGWATHVLLSALGEALLEDQAGLALVLPAGLARALWSDEPPPAEPGSLPIPATPDLWVLLARLSREAHDRLPGLSLRMGELAVERLEGAPPRQRLRAVASCLFLSAVLTSGSRSGSHPAGQVASDLEGLGLSEDAAYAWTAAGLLDFFGGDLAGGQKHLDRALRLFATAGDPVGLVFVHNSMAGLRRHAGEFQTAIAHLTAGLRIAEFWGLNRRRAALLGNLATLETETGRTARAEALLEEAVRLNHQLGLGHQAVSSLLNLAAIYLETDRLQPARQCLERARLWRLDDADPRIEQTLLKNLLTVEIRSGGLAQAGRLAARLRRSLEGHPDVWMAGQLESDLGLLLLLGGRPVEALEHQHRALELLAGRQGRQERWHVHFRAARTLVALDRRAEALDELRASISELEAMRSLLTAEHLRIPYLERRRDPYLLLLRLLQEEEPGPELAAASYQIGQGLKARVLRERLLAGDSALALSVEPELMRSQGHLEARLRLLQRRHEEAPEDDELAAQLAAARADHRRLLEELEVQSPSGLREVGLLPPPSPDEVGRAIGDRRTVLIEFLCEEDASWAWLFRGGKLQSFRLPASRAWLDESAGALEEIFSRPSSVERLGDLDLNLLHELYRRLLQPLEPHLDGVECIIAATEGPLQRLPLAALLTSPPGASRTVDPLLDAYRDLPYLVRRWAIEQTPSAAVLTAARVPASRFGDLPLLVLADPAYPRTAARLPPLPGSRIEAHGLAASFPGAVVRLGAEANRESYRELAPRARLIHLAAHGRCRAETAEHLGVALAPSSPEDDGLLRTYEIAQIRLSAELVVLSSCESALGEAHAGEGLLNLARSFLLAGAARVLVTQWPVFDEIAGPLMTSLYRQLGRGERPAQALRLAQLDLMARILHQGMVPLCTGNPFFWAPYLVVTGTAR